MRKRTFNALMARGFDSETANRIEKAGYTTLNSLKTLDVNQLRSLNIPEKLINIILKEQRPPIPPKW